MLDTEHITLQRTYRAVPATVAIVRAELVRIATSLGAHAEQVEAVRIAVSEAVTNAVVHAYDDVPGPVAVTVAETGDELWVLIADEGCGHQTPARRPGLGWGLALVAAHADGFVVAERSGGGTEVRLRFRIGRDGRGGQERESRSSAATSPARPSFSTTT